MTGVEYTALAVGALVTSTVSGIAGVGGGMLFLPILTAVVGVKLAVPYLSVLLLASNVSRAYFSREAIDWQVVRHFLLGVVPGAILGALLFTILPSFWIKKALGVYLISYVALSFTRANWPKSASLRSISWIGLPAGLVSGVVGGQGPIVTPYFLRYGLVKEGFLGTEAVGSALSHLFKLSVWAPARVIGGSDLALLLPLSVLSIAGSYFGKKLVNRMRLQVFRAILMILLAVIGVRFLFF
ncbi:sulfite exporter TauE/SafE family protein [candidate division KSB1 bacterium]|nr:sulfite exporter TauE/SafE family protein [candidate division KSB1 bacterium]